MIYGLFYELTSGQVSTVIGVVASEHTLPYLAPVDVTCSVPPSGTRGGAEQNLAEEGSFHFKLLGLRIPSTFATVTNI